MRAVSLLASLIVLLTYFAAPAVACSGDCNNDAAVTVDEIVTLVGIALGNRDVEACLAGDTTGDGMVTVDELQASINVALNGCPIIPAFATIDLTSATAMAGGRVTITALLDAPDNLVAATSNDIIYDRTLLQVDRVGSRPTCIIDPRIGPDSTANKMLLLSILNGSGNDEIVRVGVFGINRELISDGPLFQCTFTVAPGISPQAITLRNLPGASDVSGNQIENASCNGNRDPLPCCTADNQGSCLMGGASGQVVIQ